MIRAVITQREELGQHGGPVDSLEQEYVTFFTACGITVFPISSFINSVSDFLETVECDLVLLTGGGIVPHSVYRYDVEGRHQRFRDRMERELIAYALERDIPLVGICRGMHQLNGYFDGYISPFSDLPAPRAVREAHPVHVVSGERFAVNHYHRDGLFQADLGMGLKPLAWDAENRLVEAFVHEVHPLLAVQWHPERMELGTEANRWFINHLMELVRTKRMHAGRKQVEGSGREWN